MRGILVAIWVAVVLAVVMVIFYVRSTYSGDAQRNESRAVVTVREILDAQNAFREVTRRFAISYDELTTASPPFLQGDWSEPRSGYFFKMTGAKESFSIDASPVTPGRTGERHFYADQEGVVRQNTGGPATNSSPPVVM